MSVTSEKKNRFFGIILSFSLLAISLLGSFFVTRVLLKNIGDVNYGLFSFCNSITSWLLLLSEALGASYVFFATKEAKKNGNEAVTNSIFAKSLSALSALIIVLSASTMLIMKYSGFQFKNYSKEQNDLIFWLLFLSGLNVAVNVFFSSFKVFLNYKKAFIFIKSVAIGVSVLTYAFDIIIAVFTHSILLIALATATISLISGITILLFALCIKRMSFSKQKIRYLKADFTSIIRYSSILLITIAVGNLDANIDLTLLGIMVNAESVTMYRLAVVFMAYLTSLSWTFLEIMRPTIHELYSDGNIEEANRVFLKICKIQSIVILLVIGGFISCGYHFVPIWIGESKIMVYFYSTALFIVKIVPLTTQAIDEAFRATNKYKTFMVFYSLSMIVNFLLSLLLIVLLKQELAVWACVIGTVIPTFIFNWIIIPMISSRIVKLPMNKYYLQLLKNMGIAILAILPALLVAFFLHGANVFMPIKVVIEGITFVLIYTIGVLVFDKAIVKETFQRYMKKN